MPDKCRSVSHDIKNIDAVIMIIIIFFILSLSIKLSCMFFEVNNKVFSHSRQGSVDGIKERVHSIFAGRLTRGCLPLYLGRSTLERFFYRLSDNSLFQCADDGFATSPQSGSQFFEPFGFCLCTIFFLNSIFFLIYPSFCFERFENNFFVEFFP